MNDDINRQVEQFGLEIIGREVEEFVREILTTAYAVELGDERHMRVLEVIQRIAAGSESDHELATKLSHLTRGLAVALSAEADRHHNSFIAARARYVRQQQRENGTGEEQTEAKSKPIIPTESKSI